MRRFFAGTAAALLAAVLFLPVGADAVSARRAYAVDAVSGRVLYEKNPTERSLIASTTKIMTALIVCEQCNVLDRMRIPKEAVGIEGSSMYLKEGEVLTLQELLYGLMLSSGNDAAVALAIYCGGTVQGFAELMNDKARSLGLTGTTAWTVPVIIPRRRIWELWRPTPWRIPFSTRPFPPKTSRWGIGI